MPSRELMLRKALRTAAVSCSVLLLLSPRCLSATSAVPANEQEPKGQLGRIWGDVVDDGGARRRGLMTGGVPGEGLLLAVANSDEDTVDVFGDEDYVPSGGESHEESNWHKSVLPLNKWDIATIVLATFGLMIAAAGGIGGGGILVPIYILVLRFSPKYAVPLSNMTIFGGAITNTFLNMKKRHPLADRPLVDWDLILVMEPLTIGGALVGSFIQKVLPEIVLTLSMIALLVATADRTLRKGIKAFKKESKTQNPAVSGLATGKADETLLGNDAKTSASYGAAGGGGDGDVKGSFAPAELAPSATAGAAVAAAPADVEAAAEEDEMIATVPSSPVTSASEMSEDEKARALELLLEEERHTSVTKVAIMSAVFMVLLAVNLLKGGGAFDSPVGIECGSFAFWATSILSFVYLLAVSLRVRKYLVNRWQLKAELGFKYVEGDVEWTPLNTIRYPCICFFAGFFAGMFGVGGGIVKGPLMLEMGVHPMVSSSTSAVMILYTSFTATTSFIVFGLLRADYAIPLFFLGLVATAAGQYGTEYLIQKFKRPSFIILSIGSVVALSAVLMGFNGVHDLAYHTASTEDSGICSVGA